eukprot:GHVS01050139.1.p1 GENE.GHVS01050139.1~~GHVS01050139.1.p1  ORF type:complete len:217 (-),score=30.41 GHVS01050139.1:426-1076(-)
MNLEKKGVAVKKRLVLASYAFQLSPAESRRYDRMSHKWTVMLRSADGEDPSYYIKRVFYELDPTFNNPKRLKTVPPYEITEVGWGEFLLHAKVGFVDEALEPLKITHFLRLNPSKHDNRDSASGCVCAETFEEFEFTDPQEWFYEKLMAGPLQPPLRHLLTPYYGEVDAREKQFLRILQEFQSSVQSENLSLEAEVTRLAEMVARQKSEYAALRSS